MSLAGLGTVHSYYTVIGNFNNFFQHWGCQVAAKKKNQIKWCLIFFRLVHNTESDEFPRFGTIRNADILY